MERSKTIRITKNEIDAIESLFEEVSSMMEGAGDDDYLRDNKKHISAVKRVLKKYYGYRSVKFFNR